MKKLIVLFFVLSVFVLSLSAATDINDLSYTERQDYLSKAVTIETVQEHEASGYAMPLTDSLAIAHTEGLTTTEWFPYQGYKQISKGDFFTLLGYDDLAQKQYKADKFNNSMEIASWTTFGVGISAVLGGYLAMELGASDNNDAVEATGGVIALTGLVSMLVSIPLFFIRANNDVSISFAAGIAANYNAQLLSTY